MAAPIVVEGPSRSHGRRRGVMDLTFTVEDGEVFGFLDPNGAGKTTTIRLLLGLLRPHAGSDYRHLGTQMVMALGGTTGR